MKKRILKESLLDHLFKALTIWAVNNSIKNDPEYQKFMKNNAEDLKRIAADLERINKELKAMPDK